MNMQQNYSIFANKSEPRVPLRPAVKYTDERLLKFWRGGEAHITMAYETWGLLDHSGTNVVLILPGLSPDTHAASNGDDPRTGWWENMIGPGKPIDTDRFFVININHLGSCFGSSGPASLREDGKPEGLNFPAISIEDLAAGAAFVLDQLDIPTVHSVIAPSMGGLVAQAFMLRFPARFQNALIIASAARAEARSIAIHSLQRDAIRNDPLWNQGNYTADAPPLAGMRLARKIGMSSYRSSIEWEERFGNQKTHEETTAPFAYAFEVEVYLEAVAERFVHGFDANAYLYLSRAMDWFDASQHGVDLVDAFGALRSKRIDVVGVTTDTLFPVRQQKELSSALEAAGVSVRLHIVDSKKGHDAFLVDTEAFGPLMSGFLSEGSAKRLSAVS